MNAQSDWIHDALDPLFFSRVPLLTFGFIIKSRGQICLLRSLLRLVDSSFFVMDQIVNTSDHFAHVVLIALCEDPEVLRKASPLVAQLEQRLPHSALNGTKRKADDSPLFVCTQCDQVFTEAENGPQACAFHEGNFPLALVGDDKDTC